MAAVGMSRQVAPLPNCIGRAAGQRRIALSHSDLLDPSLFADRNIQFDQPLQARIMGRLDF